MSTVIETRSRLLLAPVGGGDVGGRCGPAMALRLLARGTGAGAI